MYFLSGKYALSLAKTLIGRCYPTHLGVNSLVLYEKDTSHSRDSVKTTTLEKASISYVVFFLKEVIS